MRRLSFPKRGRLSSGRPGRLFKPSPAPYISWGAAPLLGRGPGGRFAAGLFDGFRFACFIHDFGGRGVLLD
jgi:hypothetical protein